MDFISFLEVLLTFIVISAQVRCLLANRKRAQLLLNLFPDSEPLAQIIESRFVQVVDEERAITEPTQIRAVGSSSQGFRKILASTNNYLEKNAGTPADFRILQDIAERVSDAIESAAISNATLPLYIGLMGTFVGVIVGLLSFVAGSSLSSSTEAFVDPGHLRHFVGGVLIAMIGSFCGLLLSVIGRSRFLHQAQVENDRKKQSYFSLLQTELLPVIGQDVSSALYSLQKNLHLFNSNFSDNLAKFEGVMNVAKQTLTQQRELIATLNSANIGRVIATNADLLKKSETVSLTLIGFIKSVEELNHKVNTTEILLDKFNSLLNRIDRFEGSVNSLGEKIATDQTITVSTINLIKQQIETLKSRTALISEFVSSEDSDIRNYLIAQRQELRNLTDAARQQLDDISAQIRRSIADAFGGVGGNLIVDGVERLKIIDDEIQRLNTAVNKMQKSSEEAGGTIIDTLNRMPTGVASELAKYLEKNRRADNFSSRNVTPAVRGSFPQNVYPSDVSAKQPLESRKPKVSWFRRIIPRWLGGRKVGEGDESRP